jgi:hypothetical protein
MRNTIAVAAGLALTLTSAGAWAQEFGSSGTFAVSAERVFGFFYEDFEWDNPAPGGNGSVEHTTFGFGWGDPHSPYTVPRFAVDYFVIESLSVGGTITYFRTDRDDDNPNDDDDWSGFLFAPRVGYAIPFADMAGFWPRGGFSYVHFDDDPNDWDEFALNIEAMFWLSPAEGMAFVLGPTLDIGITGERDPDTDIQNTVVGVSVGLMGWL